MGHSFGSGLANLLGVAAMGRTAGGTRRITSLAKAVAKAKSSAELDDQTGSVVSAKQASTAPSAAKARAKPIVAKPRAKPTVAKARAKPSAAKASAKAARMPCAEEAPASMSGAAEAPPPERSLEQALETLLDRAETVKEEMDCPDTLPMAGAHECGLVSPDGAQPLSPRTPTSALHTPALYLIYQTLVRCSLLVK